MRRKSIAVLCLVVMSVLSMIGCQKEEEQEIIGEREELELQTNMGYSSNEELEQFRLTLGELEQDLNTKEVRYYEFHEKYGMNGGNGVYEITIKIPQLALDSLEAAHINNVILEFAEKKIAYAKNFPEELLSGESEVNFSSNIEYTLTYLDDSYASFLFDGYEYSGGAHGMPWRESLIFNMKTGQQVSGAKLFAVTEEAFKAKKIAAFEKVMEQEKEETPFFIDAMDTLKKSAGFEKDQYYLTDTGTVFYYQPYEIAPYVRGYVEAEVPYAEIPLVES